jgi:hypothetical protein
MKAIYLILFLSFSFVSLSLLANCTGDEIDNRKPTFYNEETQTHIMRDQGTSGWCYAFSSADLVTHYLARNNPDALRISNGKPVERDRQLLNPLSALASNPEVDGDNFKNETTGGQPNQFVMDLFSNSSSRICLESEMNSNNFRDRENNIVEISTLLNNVSKLANSDRTEQSNGVCQEWTTVYSNIFPGLTYLEFNSIIAKLGQEGANNLQMVTGLIQNSCKNPVNVGTLPPVKRVRRTNNDSSDNSTEFINTIETQLRSGNIIALEYFQDFLENANHPPIINEGKGKQSEGSRHVSTIVGRKCVNNEERFLIRNSFGSGCEIYDRSLECDHGNIWVSKELLLRMSSRISHL